jgi:hypothetical protein
MDDLTWILLDLWEAAPPNRRWATLAYRIEGGKFDASFIYSDELNPNDGPIERRERVLQRYYGNKRIEYPPLP